ncbi:hypothetical protein ACLOJK_020579 [Asimina triloba]
MPVVKPSHYCFQFKSHGFTISSGKNGRAICEAQVEPIGGEERGKAAELQRGQHQWGRRICVYCQSSTALNLLRAFAMEGYAAMQRVT